MLQVLSEEEHLDEARVAKSLGNLSSAFDEGIETYVCVCTNRVIYKITLIVHTILA